MNCTCTLYFGGVLTPIDCPDHGDFARRVTADRLGYDPGPAVTPIGNGGELGGPLSPQAARAPA
jgi:hypothetical protein